MAHQILPDNKLEGCTPDTLKHIFDHSSASAIIIEADGARGLSLKAPAENEPVVPDWADVCIALVGLDILGRRISAETVFRPQQIMAITGVSERATLTPQIIARLASHPLGLLKGCPPSSRNFIFFNKAENENRKAMAREIIATANQLSGNKPNLWLYGSIHNNTCTILSP